MDIKIRDAIRFEFVKCSQDYIYAIKKFFNIEHPLKGKILFKLFPFQEETLLKLIKNRFAIIVKSRQMGISTLVAAHALLNMIFRDNYKVLVVAMTQETAANLVRKVKVMYENLPTFLKAKKLVSDNKLSLELPNGSFIKAVSSSSHSGRSEALSLLIIDEAAFIDRIDDIWTASQLTLATGGSCILLSTPNGVGNLFHKLYNQAETGIYPEGLEGLEKFCPIKLPWHLHPERDQTWRDQQTQLLGARAAAQECDCDFLSSGQTVLEPDIMTWYEQNMVKEPKQQRGAGNDLWIWEFPDYTKTYIVVADVARGDGSDYSAFHVLDIETLEQVAEYNGKIGTTEYGHMLVSIATEYNHALLVIENTGVGFATVQVAIDLRYSNLHYSYRDDPFLDQNIHLAKNIDLKMNKDKVPGFTTSHILRPILVSKIDMYFREKSPKIYSKRTLNELRAFVWKNARAQAQNGYHDDLIMSLAMGLFLRDTALKLRQIGIELTKRTLQSTHKTVYVPKNTKQSPWDLPNARGGTTDLRWLI